MRVQARLHRKFMSPGPERTRRNALPLKRFQPGDPQTEAATRWHQKKPVDTVIAPNILSAHKYEPCMLGWK